MGNQYTANGAAAILASEQDVYELVTEVVGAQLRELGRAPEELRDDTDLVGGGLIDSFGLLEVIATVEERLGIEVDFEQLPAEELTVVGPFCRYVAAQATHAGAHRA